MNRSVEQSAATNKTIGYTIVEGLPNQVQDQVQNLITQGWTLNGQLYKLTIDQHDIVVQSMILQQ